MDIDGTLEHFVVKGHAITPLPARDSTRDARSVLNSGRNLEILP